MYHIFVPLLAVAVWVAGMVYIYIDAERRGKRRRENEREVVDSVEGLEITIRKKDGTLVLRSLGKEDAKIWWSRWVFQNRHLNIDHLKWKTVPCSEVKEVKWP